MRREKIYNENIEELIEELSKTKHFCPYPFFHVCNTARGQYKLCCESERVTDSNGQNLKQKDHPIIDWWNHEVMTDIRQRLLKDERIEACAYCYECEEKGIDSSRQHQINMLKFFTEEKMNAIREGSENFGIVNSTPISFDIKFGNLCNLRCRMCNSGASSNFAKEQWKQRDNADYPHHYYGDPQEEDIFDGEEIFEDFKQYVENMKFFKTTGGEPFFIQKFHDMIDYAIEIGVNKNIQMKVITNGNFFNKELLEKLNSFAKINLQCSIDGIGSHYDYIRYPAKWEKIEQNLLLFKKYPKIKPRISITGQVLNVLNIVELLTWCKENDFLFNIHPLFRPRCYDIEILPYEIKQKVLVQLDEFESKYELEGREQFGVDNFRKQLEITTHNDKEIDNFIKKTKVFDSIRKQDIRDYCPDIFEELTKLGYAF